MDLHLQRNRSKSGSSVHFISTLTGFFLLAPLFCTPSAWSGCPMNLLQPLPQEIVIESFGPHHLDEVDTFEQVRAALQINPYNYNQLPTIPVVNFSISRFDENVFTRSTRILVERHVRLSSPRRKPIHPMGIGIEGKMIFYPDSSPYSGVFRGGEFPVLGRFSISQGNPGRTEHRGEWLGYGPQIAIPQVRSTTMGLLLFDPNKKPNEMSPIVSLVLQDDLNGKLDENGESPYVLNQAISNKPVFDPQKLLDPELARLYHFGTLGGVFVGANRSFLENAGEDPNGVETTRLGLNPLLRPPQGLANFGETDPSQVRPPVWLNFVPRPIGIGHRKRDDFRKEVYETVRDSGRVIYDIYAGHQFDRNLSEVIWTRVGEFHMTTAFLPSEGADQWVIIPHADTAIYNPFTGRPIYDFIELR